MKLFGNEYSKKELARKIGDMLQLGGISLYEVIDGAGRGVKVANLKNPVELIWMF